MIEDVMYEVKSFVYNGISVQAYIPSDDSLPKFSIIATISTPMGPQQVEIKADNSLSVEHAVENIEEYVEKFKKEIMDSQNTIILPDNPGILTP